MKVIRLREDRVRELVTEYGIPANTVRFARTAADAQRLADEIEGPFAVKVVAEGVVHKSKAGGVELNVGADQVGAAFVRVSTPHAEAGRHIHGVTLEPMVAPGVEVVVGAVDHPDFGPMAMFGAGGVDVETLSDTKFSLAPLTREDAARMIESTRVGRLLHARCPDQIAALTDVIVAVSGPDGLQHKENLTELDLNPIVVTETSITAVDARACVAVSADTTPTIPDPTVAYRQLEPAIYPRSIAVVGASKDPSKIGYRSVYNPLRFGFDGPLLPISRSGGVICDIPALTEVSEIDVDIDRAVVTVPAATVGTVLEELAARGVRTAHVITADVEPFSDVVRQSGMRVLGPNCIGHYAPSARVTMIDPPASSPLPGNIAFVTQSGTYATDMVRRGANLGLRFSFVSAVGNCDDVTPSELLAFCEADPRTEIAAFYLESDSDAAAFMRLARSMTKPVILFKGGRTSAGSRAAASHTGAMAADPRTFEDAAGSAGITLVSSFEELTDLLLLLQSGPRMRGNGLAICGSGGGVAVVGTDAAASAGLDVRPLSADTQAAMLQFAAPGSSLENPVDIPVWSLFAGDQIFTRGIVETISQDMSADAVCLYLDLGTVFDFMPDNEAISKCHALVDGMVAGLPADKPATVVLRSSGSPAQDDIVRDIRRAQALAGGAAVYGTINAAIGALATLYQMSRTD